MIPLIIGCCAQGAEREPILLFTARTSTGSYGWVDVKWSPTLSMFYAVGSSSGPLTGRIMTSSNGISWTARSSAGSSGFVSVDWSNERQEFCVLGRFRSYITTDGINLTVGPEWPHVSLDKVKWVSGLNAYFAIAFNTIFRSSDGLTWEEVFFNSSYNMNEIGYSPTLGRIIVTLNGSVSFPTPLLTSTNGTSWTTVSSTQINGKPWGEIVWSEELSLFCMIHGNNTSSGQVATSSNGTDWTIRNVTPDAVWLQGISWAPELLRFVVVGFDSTYESFDGINWSKVSSPVVSYDAITYSPFLNRFCTVGGAGDVATGELS